MTAAARRWAPWSGKSVLLLVLLGTAGVSRICHADEANSIGQFNEFNRLGTEAYEKHDFETAIKNFQQAYAIKQEPLLFYNIAQSYRKINHDAEAITFYQSYLRRPETTDPELRAKAEGFLAELRGHHVPQPQLIYIADQNERRPLWRIGLGAGLLAASTVLLGFGGRALYLNGACIDTPMGVQTKCSSILDTQVLGTSLVIAGSLFAVGGVVTIALPGRRYQVRRPADPAQDVTPGVVKPLAQAFPSIQLAAANSGLRATLAY